MATDSFGERVRRYRRLHKWTQAQLGEKAEMTKAYVGKIESGVIQEPGREIQERLAAALEVPLRAIADPGWYKDDARITDWIPQMLADESLTDEWKRILEEMTRRDRDLKARDDPGDARPQRTARG